MGKSAILSIKILTDATAASKGLDTASKKVGKFSGGISKASGPAALALAGIGAAAFSAGKAAADDAQSQAILANALRNNAGATKGAIAATEDHLAAMSLASGVADDELRPAMANLVRATGDAQLSQEALAVALDVAAATGKPVEAVTKAMAKGYAGNTKALGKLVPGMDSATLASGDMSKVMGELAKKTGGASADAADTAAGRMQRMQVAMDEAKESIGTALLPAVGFLADKLGALAGFIQDNSTAVGIIVGVLGAFAAIIVVLNVAISVYTTVTTLAGIASGIAWLAALWPILLVIAAVLLVVGVIVLLWKKCEWFRDAVTAVWDAIRAAFTAVVDWLVNAWNAAWEWIAGVVNRFRTFFALAILGTRIIVATVVAWIRAKWDAVFAAVVGFVERTKRGFARIFGAIKAAVGVVADGIKRAWQTVFDALSRAVATVSGVIQKPFNVVKDAIDNVIGAVRKLIEWFGRIKVPHIDIPFFGKSAPAAAGVGAPGIAAAGARAGARAATPARAGGITVVIQGAVDPESTARQVRRILTAHDRRMGVGGLRAGTV